MKRMAGRDHKGRFTVGNQGGPGNPYTKRISELRSALLAEVKPDDLRAIVRMLVSAAKGGDVAAAREVLLRTLGKPVEADLLERLEALEERAKDEGPRWTPGGVA